MGLMFGWQGQKLNLFDVPYCRSMKLNFVYIFRVNIWCDLPIEHSFYGFCAMKLVITYVKWLLTYWILCVWFLGWKIFFLLTLLSSYLLCGGLLSIWCRGFFGKGCSVCVCVEPESGCSACLVQWLDWVEQWLCYPLHFCVMAEVTHQPYLAWNKCLIKPCLHCDNFIIYP